MTSVTTRDGVQIFHRDWGPKTAQPIGFHHGWPPSSDDRDARMLYFIGKGYRVVAHDRRSHGRSSQVSDGHDMDHHAADVAVVVEHLDLRNAIHIGHSSGGGEAVRYVARHGKGRVAKLVLVGALLPLMLKTAANPGGWPTGMFDGRHKERAASRSQVDFEVASGPTGPSQAALWNRWRLGAMGVTRAHDGSLEAFSEMDFSEDLKCITVPTVAVPRDARVVAVADAAPLSSAPLKITAHRRCTAYAVNVELLSFVTA